MSVAKESSGRARQLREKALELSAAAARTTDPELRQRLEDKARRLQQQSEQPGMGGQDAYAPWNDV
ncbi:DUF6381 family protein [Streptomyces sp. MS2.AVA.5]|uniref:DUF6381 family protein n=1 Tax=Streptomyces achmelvichensis TaxID=3134111 RepID=A0ACC6PNP3_9ACTN